MATSSELKLVTITGPSCAGKTTLIRKLLESGPFCELVSFTTRERRIGEVEGVDYYFISVDHALSLIKHNKVIESITFKGNIYGTLIQEYESKVATGKIPLVILDPHGLDQYVELLPKGIYTIYIDSPVSTLIERFLTRIAQEVQTPDSIKYNAKRLEGMLIEHEDWIDYPYYHYIEEFTSENQESR